MKTKSKKISALFLFFVSGVISLVFQVSWLKMLLPVFGNTVWAVGTLLTAFMTGLAIGSWKFGKIADRIGSPLKLYGILEGFIGIYGILTLFIFSKMDLLYIPLYSLSGGDNLIMGIIKFLLGLLILLPPTICMGGTLPLLARQFSTEINTAGSGIGFFYTVNTFGAVVGTFVTGFYLIPVLGLRHTVITGAVFNFFIFGAVWLLTRSESIKLLPSSPAFIPQQGLDEKNENKWVAGIYFICGLTGLAYEVIWNRLLTLHLGSSVYAYSIMLAVFLMGITLGAGIMSGLMKRIKNVVRIFAFIQIGLALDLVISIFQFSNFSNLRETIGNYVQGESYFSFILTLVIATFQLLIIPTVLMGASFPLAVSLYLNKENKVGQDTGRLYAFNTLGTIVGSFCGGFLLLPLVGAQKGLLIIASLNLAAGVFLVFKDRYSLSKKAAISFGVSVVFFAGYYFFTTPNQVIMMANIFQGEENVKVKLLAFEEDIYATVTVEEREEVRGKWRQLSMNGVGVAGTSGELFSIQKLQGHLPLMLHPNPKSVLHIGFGSGGTAYAVSRYPVEKITIAEISRSIIKKASHYFTNVNHGVLKDPRVNVVFTDGRNKVLADTETYDVILSDSIHPRFSGNGSLYTYDYYKLLKKRLKPGGLVSQWLPFYSITPENFKMIVRSFYEVFPYTSVWYANSTMNSYVIVIGKLDNGEIDFSRISKCLTIPGVAKDLKEIDCENPYKLIDFLLFTNEKVKDYTGNVPLHTDDNMAVEYLSGRALSKSITSYLNFDSLIQARRSYIEPLVNLVNFLNPAESKDEIVNKLKVYWVATTYNLEGQRLFWEGKREEAFLNFNMIPRINPENKVPVEYFGSSYQEPFLKNAVVESN